MLCAMHGHHQTPSVPPPTKGAFRPLVACCSPVVGLWVSSLFLLLDLHVIPIKETEGLVYFCHLVPHFEDFHSLGVTVNKLCEFILL
jgi:hypothetical protein